MRKGVRFRAYPNKAQQAFLDRSFGCVRLIYNKGLALRKEAFDNGLRIGYKETSSMLTDLKKQEEYDFLNEVDSIALQQCLRDLDRAYTNFFERRSGYPRFRSKHDLHQSYRTLNQKDNIRITDRYIKLPKLGYLKIRQTMEVGKIHNVTVEKSPTGKYFVVLNVDFEPECRANDGGVTGIDMGIREFYTDSNGITVMNPKYLEKSEKKLAREQRRLSRKQKGSNNRNRQRIKVAGIHEKITNQREDFLHKESTKLVSENQTICIEDLNVKGMMHGNKYAKHIASVSLSTFFSMLEYKANWYGSKVIKVPRYYASSQTCSHCGYVNPAVKDLTVRRWECPQCHTVHDRDYNASINILNKGLEILRTGV